MDYKKYDICPVTKNKCAPTCGFHIQNLGCETHLEGVCTLVMDVLKEHPIIDKRQYDHLIKAHAEVRTFDEKYAHLVEALELE